MDQIQFQSKKWYVIRTISGGGVITLSTGKFSIFNIPFNSPLSLNCNAGDSYIVNTETNVILETQGVEIVIENLLANPIPEDWRNLKVDLQPVKKNIVIVLGASDSGKTTLIKYLAINFMKKQKIGLIDLDVGQNSLGLPGTINCIHFTLEKTELLLTKYFGFLSPAGNSDIYLQVIEKFMGILKTFDFSWIFIDTSGYIQTSEGLEIHKKIINICQPQTVLLLGEEAASLEIILPIRNIRYIKVSSAIKGIKHEKSPETRRNKRNERFQKYFLTATLSEITLERIKMLRVYDQNQKKELDNKISIDGFLKNNSRNIKNLFISICSNQNEVLCYSTIMGLNDNSLRVSIPNHIILPNEVIVEIGTIYLDKIPQS